MARTRVSRTIDAPVALVFDTVAHIENFAKAIPDIIKTEFLSDQHKGVGTRFRETRLMGKRQASTVLEVTEYVPGERVRLVADAGGTLWDSVFTVREAGGKTAMEFTMEASPHKFLAKLLNPLIKGFVRKAIEKDVDAVKVYCEQRAAAQNT